MSRMKDPPKEMCLIRTVSGEWLPFCEVKETNLLEICGLKVAHYDLREEAIEKPRRGRRAGSMPRTQKPVKTGDSTPEKPAEDATEAENETSKDDTDSKLKFHCRSNKCGKDFDEPKESGTGAYQCPHCGSLRIESK